MPPRRKTHGRRTRWSHIKKHSKPQSSAKTAKELAEKRAAQRAAAKIAKLEVDINHKMDEWAKELSKEYKINAIINCLHCDYIHEADNETGCKTKYENKMMQRPQSEEVWKDAVTKRAENWRAQILGKKLYEVASALAAEKYKIKMPKRYERLGMSTGGGRLPSSP